MTRSHRGSSHSYPGRPVSQASEIRGTGGGNIFCDETGVSRGHSRCRTSPKADGRLETSSVNRKAGRIRRRIRMCYWKQWRYARTKVRNLLKLGTNKRHAILSALSRKSYWHMSRTLATQSGMTNQWLADQGLVSIKKLWSVIHYPPQGGTEHSPATAR